MNETSMWDLIHAERAHLADTLGTLTPPNSGSISPSVRAGTCI
jgi:hypothetical protein